MKYRPSSLADPLPFVFIFDFKKDQFHPALHTYVPPSSDHVSTTCELYYFGLKVLHYWDCAGALFLNEIRAFYSLEPTLKEEVLRAVMYFDNRLA